MYTAYKIAYCHDSLLLFVIVITMANLKIEVVE
jgi:hypothetical protein